MTRILLADDSPHAQRMGERILREEGFEVVTVTDGETALVRLGDVDPDLILADAFLPKMSGLEICRHVKSDPKLRHVRIIITAGSLEQFDEEEARGAGCDAILKKPFEASGVVEAVKPLLAESKLAREMVAKIPAVEEAAEEPIKIDSERVRAAVTIALDAAMPALIDEITEKVLVALGRA